MFFIIIFDDERLLLHHTGSRTVEIIRNETKTVKNALFHIFNSLEWIGGRQSDVLGFSKYFKFYWNSNGMDVFSIHLAINKSLHCHRCKLHRKHLNIDLKNHLSISDASLIAVPASTHSCIIWILEYIKDRLRSSQMNKMAVRPKTNPFCECSET